MEGEVYNDEFVDVEVKNDRLWMLIIQSVDVEIGNSLPVEEFSQ